MDSDEVTGYREMVGRQRVLSVDWRVWGEFDAFHIYTIIKKYERK
jgi:hypothetical protein